MHFYNRILPIVISIICLHSAYGAANSSQSMLAKLMPTLARHASHAALITLCSISTGYINRYIPESSSSMSSHTSESLSLMPPQNWTLWNRYPKPLVIISEEIFFTYMPYYLLKLVGKEAYAGIIMLPLFAIMHSNYSLRQKLLTTLAYLPRIYGLVTCPEYVATPIISHVLYNLYARFIEILHRS